MLTIIKIVCVFYVLNSVLDKLIVLYLLKRRRLLVGGGEARLQNKLDCRTVKCHGRSWQGKNIATKSGQSEEV